VLQRGYSLTRKPDGTVVTDAAQVAPGEHVNVRLARGELDVVVQSGDRPMGEDGADE